MSWQSHIATIKAAPRTAVGPKTEAVTLYGPPDDQGVRIDWRGVKTSPVDLHKAANLDKDVYAIGRCIVSEVGTSNPYAALAAAECLVNAAKLKGVDPYQWLVASTSSRFIWTKWKYGEQRGRRASTRQDPDARSITAARIALGESIGFVGGATTWFDPKTQDGGRQGTHQLANDAIAIANKWASEDAYEWIGPLPGIDSYRDVCYLRKVKGRPADPSALISLIELGRAGKDTSGPSSPHPQVAAVGKAGQPWLSLVATGAALLILV